LRDMPRLSILRDRLQTTLMRICSDAIVAGCVSPRVANTLSIALPGLSAETQVAAMDLAGIAVSAGSACSSGKVKASHVLHAMGYAPEVAGSALRISLGWHTEAQDIERCAEAWQVLVRRTRTINKSQAA
jgi:cysteine desulfurase